MTDRAYLLVALALAAENKAPSEFLLFRAGDNSTRKGVFKFDADAAKSVLAHAAQFGARYSIDYNHAQVTAQSAPNPSEAGKSAGTFTLAVREGALWAVDVQWTAEGAQRVAAKEYVYTSPFFRFDKGGRVLEVLNCALTNVPATHGLSPLVLDALADRPESSGNGVRMEGVLIALGLAKTASEGDAFARATDLRTSVAELCTLTATNSTHEALGAVRAGIDAIKRLPAISAQLAIATARETAREIDDAIKAGKLTPAQREWAVKYGAESPDGLRAYLSAAPVIVALDAETKPSAKAPASQPVTLGAEDLAVCTQLGLDPVKFAQIDAPASKDAK